MPTKKTSKLNQTELVIILFGVFIVLLSPLIIFKKVKKPSQVDIDVVTPKNIEKGENTPKKTIKVNIKGTVKGLLLEEEIPETLIKVLDNNQNIIESTTPDFNGKFELSFLAEANSQITVTIENSNYVFFPQKQFIKTEEEDFTTDIFFEGSLTQTTAQNLTIKGNIKGFFDQDTLIYLIGSSVVTNEEVKKIIHVNKQGQFEFESLDSGTYVLIPYSKKAVFIPKSKEIKLKNTNKKIMFLGLRKLY